MREFTLDIYELMLKSFDLQGYGFSTFEEYVLNHKNKVIILKHDVDKLPENALRMANLEKRLGIKTSYYFRTIDQLYDENIIKQIADMGHEVGYHYEDLDLSSRGQRSEVRGREKIEVGGRRSEVRRARARVVGWMTDDGHQKELDYDALLDKSIKSFERNLSILREVVSVKTICMHGSPLSRYDNQKIWEKYDYRDYGIIADCYLDVDFDEVFYITDTGRSWNNSNASIRDKVNSKFDITIKDTNHLIEKIQNNDFPDKIMINVHPQRWNDEFVPWVSELVRQGVKNVIKRWVIRREEFRSQNPGARR